MLVTKVDSEVGTMEMGIKYEVRRGTRCIESNFIARKHWNLDSRTLEYECPS